ncbi:aminopeptidase B [Strongylocentrotus purpuratus]|uniref:Peptidase M1 leukotriene A4 hydrolase/aminopeptidase C-terminal domain-containing protein n=1 Tax=Strongylocentrotus purpuratus TaxID=7668 RepID=A0A7M7PQ28_STRPU|nr:aminopeptidase B [Strongylocentrotus purpuratus]
MHIALYCTVVCNISQNIEFKMSAQSDTSVAEQASKRTKQQPLHSDTTTDNTTASNFRHIKITHFHLGIKVDFSKKELAVKEVIDVKCLQKCDAVILDSHESIQISSIVDKSPPEADLQYEVKPFTGYGSALHISRPCSEVGEEFKIEITYTVGKAPGLCWLDPSQTAGKSKPYLYTQGQAVLNRSFFPCLDTPAVKSTYSATVHVPSGFAAVMSADQWGKDVSPDIFTFRMNQRIPSYLVALAVGDIASAQIGPRSNVWTEPCLLDKAQAEFSVVVEDYISTAERLFGPYVWGRYDILVMPPSFPFGGMENPCLTFVTPCLLVGDKSLTDVVMHEIAHSWFGNLVTNATWGDFWLNEGFTMFAQRCISQELLGEAYTCLEAATGRALLKQRMTFAGEDHPLNRLRVVIDKGIDPEDTYNEVPYEKGFAFVSYLASLVGGKSEFTKFLKSYCQQFKFKSVVAEDLFDAFLDFYPELQEQKITQKKGFEFDHWLNGTSWPPFVPDLSAGRTLMDPAEKLASYWLSYHEEKDNKDLSLDISEWKTYQVLHFIDQLVESEESLPHETLKHFATTYPQIRDTHNAEIRLRWSQLTIGSDYADDLSNVKAFLIAQGKQKYTLPIYAALTKGSKRMKDFAVETFAATKDQLHINVRKHVEKMVSVL